MEVVGYSTEEVGWTKSGEKFNIFVNQFRNADGSEKVMKISDLTCNQSYTAWDYQGYGFQPGPDTIQLFSDDGQMTNALSYASAGYMEENYYFGENKPGWYPSIDVNEGEFDNPQGDCYVKYGQGFVIKAGSGNGVMPTVTFAGEVKRGVIEIPGSGNFTFAGNCTPVDTTMEKITCNQSYTAWDYEGYGFQPGADSVQIFTPEGSLSVALSYASAGYMEENYYVGENKPGWYPAIDVNEGEFENPQGSIPVPAGSGFVFKSGTGNGVWPTITIPAAIEDK